ncbi:hypothetical protein [Chitinophaga rhizophila]|uniref:Uncharacterized protein n=1 Tax=Chitinophaga rhizophila TaxID=2866212 RepID=A0ABS7GKB4_9BACT|nr:hypothetical protein [Chitinophaga rhizophila]MBW8687721.1 hypothetical protein [Chitinophaga rhizophila]
MKTTFFITLATVLSIALLITYMVKKEQRSMSQLSARVIKLVQKFHSWQTMK